MGNSFFRRFVILTKILHGTGNIKETCHRGNNNLISVCYLTVPNGKSVASLTMSKLSELTCVISRRIMGRFLYDAMSACLPRLSLPLSIPRRGKSHRPYNERANRKCSFRAHPQNKSDSTSTPPTTEGASLPVQYN